MVTKLRQKIVGSPFLWVSSILFVVVLLFFVRKNRQLKRDTEKKIEMMVRNISHDNVNKAVDLFMQYDKLVEQIGAWSGEGYEDNFNFIASRDAAFRNLEIVDCDWRGELSRSNIRIIKDNGVDYIEYIHPLLHEEEQGCVSLCLSLEEFHSIIAEHSNITYSYLTIVKDGKYVYHPDEKLLGEVICCEEEDVYGDNPETLLSVYSDYLNIPVYLYYKSVDIEGYEWYFVSNTPAISFSDFISDTRSTFFSVFLFALVAFIVIFLLGLMQWKREFVKKQALQTEKINLELQNEQNKQRMLATELKQLKSGLNPHFLFNSLSSLSILVDNQPDEAKSFAKALSAIYKYLLNQQAVDTVTLRQELEFVRNYIYLQKIRFRDRIVANIEIDDKLLGRTIPPVSLQLLVENCIKHTKMTHANPLYINIYVEDDYLVVTNNYNPVDNGEMSGMGLSNLTKRYAYLTSKPCSFLVDNNHFVSKIPLI